MPSPLESLPFESLGALPLHPVVVPFAVVLIGLCALFLIVLVLVPRWASKFGPITLVGLGLGTLAAFVAAQSGPALATATQDPGIHGIAGRVAPWASAGLFVLALVWLLIRRAAAAKDQPRSAGALVTGVLTAVVSVAVVAGIGLVGYAGLTLVWGTTLHPIPITPTAPTSPGPIEPPNVQPSEGVQPSDGPSSKPQSGTTSYTLKQVAQHADVGSCWTAINGQVYDLTSWIDKHPGGPDQILELCGTDGSAAFNLQHTGDSRPASELTAFRLGPLQ